MILWPRVPTLWQGCQGTGRGKAATPFTPSFTPPTPSTTGLAQKIQGLVDDAVAKGAKVLAGGKLPQHLPGQFYPPTVITNINKSMEIWSEEVFGPVGVSYGCRPVLGSSLHCSY